jgi:hypothetical protein
MSGLCLNLSDLLMCWKLQDDSESCGWMPYNAVIARIGSDPRREFYPTRGRIDALVLLCV